MNRESDIPPAEAIGTYVPETDALADAIVLQDAALLDWALKAMALPRPPALQVVSRDGQGPWVVKAPAAGR